MPDPMGTTASAAKSRKGNEPSEKAGTKTIQHEASRAERESIGRQKGDRDQAR